MKFFKCKHRWRTVAIDTRYGWYFVRNPDKVFDHILLYQICDKCKERRVSYDGPTEEGRKYAEFKNDSVALCRSIWIHKGTIHNAEKGSSHITYIDTAYAPLAAFEDYIKQMRTNPEISQMIKDHQMVSDALGQLEVAVKLCRK